jgi:hypothetical protein
MLTLPASGAYTIHPTTHDEPFETNFKLEYQTPRRS